MNISSIEASKVGAGKAGKAGKRDKLAQTKLRERQLREAHKLDLQAKKTAKENSVAEQKEILRQERMTHDTRRARADRRRMQASLAKAERGEEARCEHGFAHCKLCNMRG
mmetsp:Transcript_15250/g.43389  ORF Transcript_15250/g.43389 Transcript_15250/m.43389 type:complete len:110 (-) Transcript_15250:195-524(-)